MFFVALWHVEGRSLQVRRGEDKGIALEFAFVVCLRYWYIRGGSGEGGLSLGACVLCMFMIGKRQVRLG